jgi:SPP1 family predicted phage head-tail adaptor
VNLRHRITIQSLVNSQDETTGIMTSTYETFAVVYAEVHPLSAREFIAANMAQSNVTARITIRYLAGIKPSMRILHGDSVFNIEGVLADPRSGIEYLTLPVSEVVYG